MTDSTFDVEAFKRDMEAAFARALDELAALRADVAQLRTAPDRSPLYSAKDVAVRLGISERTARQMIADGVLPSVKTGGLTKVEPAEVDAYLDRQKGVGSPVRQAE
jgi:excisionase family DNA binding protein